MCECNSVSMKYMYETHVMPDANLEKVGIECKIVLRLKDHSIAMPY